MKKVIFMGTPDFAVKSLEALLREKNIEVVGVVTQPDREVGRKHQLVYSPVKEVAIRENLPLFQPERISKDDEVEAFMKDQEVDLLVTAAYGQFIPDRILTAAKFGAINVHGSLLPKHRGGAPIQRALWQGDKETGISIIEMVHKMDAGRIYARQSLPIEEEDTSSTLFEKLAVLGSELLIQTLPGIFDGSIIPIEQNPEEVTISPNISSEEEKINWLEPAEVLNRQLRALSDQPGAFTFLDHKRWKIWKGRKVDGKTDQEPGTVIKMNKKPAQLWLAAGEETILSVEVIQPFGKKKMDISSFMNGGAHGLKEGSHFE